MVNIGAEDQIRSSLPLQVVAAVIRRRDGFILLSLRREDADQGGLWEFPGGKTEAGERAVDALARELKEELGISISRTMPLIRTLHYYPDKAVSLTVHEVTEWEGAPSGCEGQELRWLPPDQLDTLNFPAANVPVTVAVRLPRLTLVTPPLGSSDGQFLSRLERCIESGIRLVQLRMVETDPLRRTRVARAALDLCRVHGALLMINGSPREAMELGADGVHLSSRRLLQMATRPVPATMLMSAACHNAAELRHAETVGADFVYISPVRATATHPDASPLGWHGLRALVRSAGMPVFALGGMRARDTLLALRFGCQGVAMMSGVWDNQRPEEIVNAVTQAARSAAYTARER